MSRNVLFALAAVLFLGAIGYLFLPSQGEITNYPPGDGPILAFGDSLVAGNGSTANNDFISLLSARIGEPIINLGVPGDTTADGLERIDRALMHEPRIVLLLLGGNDYLRRVPPEDTFQNLRAIIDRLHEEGALVVLLGVRGGVLRDNFGDSFKELAREKGAAYVPDVLDGLLGDTALMADQVHPNDAGYARIAEKVAPVLEPLLR